MQKDVKPLLKFSILTDREDRNKALWVNVCLFRENDALVWRLHGPAASYFALRAVYHCLNNA